MDIGFPGTRVAGSGDDVTFLGSPARDLVGIVTEGAVIVDGGEGDNRFDTVGGRSTTVTVGDGDNRIDARIDEDVTVRPVPAITRLRWLPVMHRRRP